MRPLVLTLALLVVPTTAQAQPSSGTDLDAPPTAIHMSYWSAERERERHELQRHRYAIDLRFPASLTGMGAGTLLIGALMVIGELAKHDYDRDPDVSVAGAVLVALGAATMLPGSIWLGIAAHRARVLDQAIEALDAPTLQIDLGLGPGGIALRGRF